MPLATHPNATYEVVLSTDSKLPKEKQPVFVFRYLSITDWEEVTKLNDKSSRSTDSKELIDMTFEIIKKTLCGWRNMKMPSGQKMSFNFKRLKSMVTLQEATELMQAGVSQRPSLGDKKKLDSRSRSNTAKDAKTAKD